MRVPRPIDYATLAEIFVILALGALLVLACFGLAGALYYVTDVPPLIRDCNSLQKGFLCD